MTEEEKLLYYIQREGNALTKLKAETEAMGITNEHFIKALDEVGHCWNNIMDNAFEVCHVNIAFPNEQFKEIIKEANIDSKSALQTNKEFWEAERSNHGDDEER